jgi:D-3-phosphoglycerate dehydrogenase
MKILIADKFPDAGCDALRAQGHVVELRADLGAKDLPGALSTTSADILVVRSTKVTRAAFEAHDGLSLVIRAGAGVNTIDLESASRRGVYVANCPGKNAIAVAELAFGLMLSLDRQIPDAVSDLRERTWNKKKYGKGRGLHGRCLGIVGFGNIGRELAKRGLAFGMRVRAFDPMLDEESARELGVEPTRFLDELMRDSDVVSVHAPLNEATRHMIGAREIALMPEGGILLHTARGGVVDDEAVIAAVTEGRIRAGFDVFEDEPSQGLAEFNSPLPSLAGFYGTPHIGASTAQAAAAIAEEVLRIIGDFASKGVVHNTVNVVRDRPARFSLVVRHLDRVGVLAHILEELRREQLNVQEMQNVVFAGEGAAASATIALAREPSDALLSQLRAEESILAVDLRAATEG